MGRVRILLADDHALLLDGLCKLLENDFAIVGTVTNGRDLVTAAEKLQPEMILLDIAMPLLNGLDAARQLKQRGVRAKLVFVTMHTGTKYVLDALRVGAAGYVLKQSVAAELVDALHKVARGKLYITPLVRPDELTLRSAVNPRASGRVCGQLTLRQREVLQLVAEGHAAKSIADLLGITCKTVEFHKGNMLRELGLRSSADLIRYAISQGLVGKD
jgi:DNA-binding NarL/FixJ family response regulator